MMTDGNAVAGRMRPAVSVVMPFAGDSEALEAALSALLRIETRECDELVLVDNSPGCPAAGRSDPRVRLLGATLERSSYYARNAGAEATASPWILFIDSDCVPAASILDAFFDGGIDDDIGAVAGNLIGLADQSGLAPRWARTRELLSTREGLDSDRPAAPTACLLVRRKAWQEVGGFFEGVRSGADLDFCWRLGDAGWRVRGCLGARVEHRHRTTVRSIVRQMARYAAGNEWQRRRGSSNTRPRELGRRFTRAGLATLYFLLTARPTESALHGLDAVAIASQAAGRGFGNAAHRENAPRGERRLVLATDRFPVVSETFVTGEIAALVGMGWNVRVEAVARPDRPARAAARGLRVNYLEDEGALDRAGSLAWLAARHPVRAVADLAERRRFAPEERMPLRALAPAARRLASQRDRNVHVHFAALAAANALRVGRILGTPVSVTAHAHEIYAEPRALAHKLRRAKFTAATCEYVARDLRALLPAGDRDRVAVVAMGVSCDDLRRNRPYPGGNHVVALGRLVEKKGFEYLVEAASIIASRSPGAARFTIAGNGPLRERLERRIADLGVGATVALREARDPGAVLALLEEADVFALPCVIAADGDRDSMPVVAKEALAAEVPVVGTDEVGIPEVVQDDWGRLVPPRDAAALANAIEEILSLPVARRLSMGAAGRDFVCRRFDRLCETKKLDRLLSQAAG